jgi:hypothetical protein
MRPIISALAALGLLVLICFSFHRSHYPFGERPCCLPCTLECLREYAAVHKGCFPDGHSPQNALSKLYFEGFISADLLAGISGDIKLAERELSSKSDISDEASSWVYWPGFRDTDDPKIAIIWERRSGFRFDGKRIPGGHAVGFIDGINRVISDSDWDEFLREQKSLREQAQENRKSMTPNGFWSALRA